MLRDLPFIRRTSCCRGDRPVAPTWIGRMLWGVCIGVLSVFAWGAPPVFTSPLPTQQVMLTTVDGVEIRAFEIADGKDAMLIYCHRLMSGKESFDLSGFGGVFAREFDVLAFDFRGHRQSRWISNCGGDEVLDLRAAVQYARATGHRKIVLLGVGMGGVVAIRAAALFGNVDAVVAVSPCAQPEALKPWWWNLAAHISLTTDYGKIPIRILNNTRIAGRYWTGSPMHLVDRVSPAPLLLVHGMGDRYLDLEQVQALYDCAGPPKKLLILPRPGHAEGLLDEATAERIVAWLDEMLPDASPEGVDYASPVAIDEIELQGDLVLPERMIRDAIERTADGALTRQEQIAQVKEAVEVLHRDRGYLLSRVSEIHLSEDGRLSLGVRVDRIDRLAIEGNRHIPSERIRQVLRLAEGSPYNTWEVETAVRRLRRFPVFASVESRLRQDADGRTVRILVRDRRPWAFGLATRWTDYDKFGGVSFSLNEFRASTWRGFGQVLFGLSHRRPLYRVRLEKGWFRPEALVVGLAFNRDIYNWYDWTYSFGRMEIEDLGGGADIAYRITDNARVYLAVSRNRLAFLEEGVEDEAVLNLLALRWEQQGRFLRRGESFLQWRAQIFLETAATWADGEYAYTLYQVNISPQLALSPGQSLRFSLHGGGSRGDVPPQKLFALGGDKTLLGYPDDEFLGERFFLVSTRYDLQWGRWLDPLSRLVPLGGSLALDAGDARMRGEQLRFDAPKLEVGLELNYATVIRLGVIRTLGKDRPPPFFYVAWYPHFVRTRL